MLKRLLAAVLVFALLGCGGSGPPAGQPVDNAPMSLYNTDGSLKADASRLRSTVITATLAEPMAPGKNILWCSTFQLAWNEMCRLLGRDVRLENEPPMVALLNKHAATKDDLDDASYLAMAGRVSEGITEKIRRAVAEKFPGESIHPPEPGALAVWVAYAVLVKNLEFAVPFDSLEDRVMEFGGCPVRWFGFTRHSDRAEQLHGQVLLLDKGLETDRRILEAVVELRTKSPGDRLILAMVKPGATLGETVAEVRRRAHADTPSTRSIDEFAVPKLDFDLRRRYTELEGLTVAGSRVPMIDALQDVRFRLNERGVTLLSQALATVGGGPPRVLVFDRPFLFLMERRGAKAPYFALWVETPELLVPESRERVALMKNMPFDQVESFSEGLAAVRIDRNWTYIDTTGRFIAPLMDASGPSADNMAEVRRRFLETGVPPGATPSGPAKDPHGGLTPTRKDGLVGFTDRTGKFVIEPQFEYATEFNDERAIVLVTAGCGVIDTAGRFVVAPIYVTARNEGFCNGFAAVAIAAGPGEGDLPRLKWGFVDTSGRMLEIRP